MGDSRNWDNVVDIYEDDGWLPESHIRPTAQSENSYLWYEGFEWGKNMFIIHFGTNVVAPINTEIPVMDDNQ